MKSTGLRLLVIILALFALGLLGAWVFLAYTTYGYRQQVALVESEARDISSESSYLVSVRLALRDTQDELARIDELFISKDSVPEYIDLMEKEAARAGIKADFGSIEVKEGSSLGDNLLTIKMTGMGTWSNIIGFISTLESLPHLITISDVGLQRSGSTADSTAAEPNWNFHISLTQNLTQNP